MTRQELRTKIVGILSVGRDLDLDTQVENLLANLEVLGFLKTDGLGNPVQVEVEGGHTNCACPNCVPEKYLQQITCKFKNVVSESGTDITITNDEYHFDISGAYDEE